MLLNLPFKGKGGCTGKCSVIYSRDGRISLRFSFYLGRLCNFWCNFSWRRMQLFMEKDATFHGEGSTFPDATFHGEGSPNLNLDKYWRIYNGSRSVWDGSDANLGLCSPCWIWVGTGSLFWFILLIWKKKLLFKISKWNSKLFFSKRIFKFST